MRDIVFGVAGGLALFIYGMSLMGEGLKKAAGDRMRSILASVTRNPLMGIGVGALVTAILQSSSATMVMTIGFVNARLITLTQAIGIIIGANIGTTITAQLIAFKIGDFAYPIAAVGDRKSTRLNFSHVRISYAVFCLKKKKYTGVRLIGYPLELVAVSEMPVEWDMHVLAAAESVVGVVDDRADLPRNAVSVEYGHAPA